MTSEEIFDKESFYFIREALELAKKKNDKKVILYKK